MHACPNCRRHIRESECPFCHAKSDAQAPAPRELISRKGLRRGALVASVFAATACAPVAAYGIPLDANNGTDSQTNDSQTTTDSMTADDAIDESVVAAYGIPPADVMSGDDASDAPVAAYGIPPQDAGEDSGVAPAYGIPPADGGR